MLKYLRIANIILVENAEIPFEKGLNVLSGETGSGKSAIMEAISLVLGERADVSLIRRGCDRGTVEALFEIDQIAGIHSLLDQGGIVHHPGEELVIRREVLANGKSRAFINNQMAQLAFLKTLGSSLVEIVGQQANQRLRTIDSHRDMIDVACDLGKFKKAFQTAYQHENQIRKELELLVSSEAQRLRELEVCKMELEELQETNVKEGEDEELFAEYTLLSNSEELMRTVSEINQALTGERQAILQQLNRVKANFEQLIPLVPSMEETAKTLNGAHAELQEIAYTMRSYEGNIEYNPAKAEEINQRLTQINRLKRKYGATVEEIQNYQAGLEAKLEALESADETIDKLRQQLAVAEKETNEAADKLSQQRKSSAKKLEKVVTTQLRALNMPKVEFHVEISAQKRSAAGDDRIEFFMAPNVGENPVPVKDSASGGEMSRLMLALQTVLAGKEQTPTLVFDEIDANIGGETAAVIGEKLREIGEKHQLLCITHFPQVARQAQHHLQIFKNEVDGRTLTHIAVLDKQARLTELSRMLGGAAVKL